MNYDFLNASRRITVVEDTRYNTPILGKKITSSLQVYEEIKANFQEITLYEEFHVMYLSRANEVVGTSLISIGGQSGTVADAKIIFATAFNIAGTSAIILIHNHPSGQLKPSDADINLTRKISEFGKMIDLPILDHLIITDKSYYSFADDGKL